MLGILMALLSGALMSVQGVFNTEATKQTSLWVAAGFVQLTAFAACTAAWLATGRESIAAIGSVRPWYLLLGGDRRVYYDHRCAGDEPSWSSAGCHADCNRTGGGGVADSAVWSVRYGKDRFFLEKANWNGACGRRDYSVSVGKERRQCVTKSQKN